MSSFFKRHAVRRLAVLRPLLQGDSPERLALGLALGITLGLAPVVWGTTLICLVFALVLRLPLAAVQAGNYAVYPLQIALFIPFLTAGQYLLAPRQLGVLSQVRQTLTSDPLLCARLFWQVNLRGMLVWLAMAPLLMWGLNRLARRLLSRPSP